MKKIIINFIFVILVLGNLNFLEAKKMYLTMEKHITVNEFGHCAGETPNQIYEIDLDSNVITKKIDIDDIVRKSDTSLNYYNKPVIWDNIEKYKIPNNIWLVDGRLKNILLKENLLIYNYGVRHVIGEYASADKKYFKCLIFKIKNKDFIKNYKINSKFNEGFNEFTISSLLGFVEINNKIKYLVEISNQEFYNLKYTNGEINMEELLDLDRKGITQHFYYATLDLETFKTEKIKPENYDEILKLMLDLNIPIRFDYKKKIIYNNFYFYEEDTKKIKLPKTNQLIELWKNVISDLRYRRGNIILNNDDFIIIKLRESSRFHINVNFIKYLIYNKNTKEWKYKELKGKITHKYKNYLINHYGNQIHIYNLETDNLIIYKCKSKIIKILYMDVKNKVIYFRDGEELKKADVWEHRLGNIQAIIKDKYMVHVNAMWIDDN